MDHGNDVPGGRQFNLEKSQSTLLNQVSEIACFFSR